MKVATIQPMLFAFHLHRILTTLKHIKLYLNNNADKIVWGLIFPSLQQLWLICLSISTSSIAKRKQHMPACKAAFKLVSV